MGDFLQYLYVILWGVLAVLMFLTGRKQGALAYVLAIFFVFMTAWYGLRAFAGYAMFDGALGIVFKCVLGAFLVGFVATYFVSKHKRNK
jgi:hypothetical protein